MISDTMKYIEIASAGGPEVLRLSETVRPKPQTGQVLIKVAAAGLNRMDILQRKGLYPPPAGTVEIPGVEVAGEIVTVGKDCGRLKEGDMICALLTGGGYAEYALADAPLCLPIPRGFNLVEAASLPEALFTVWNNVFDIGGLQTGQILLVHGGSSGVGSAAIQMARAFGARVFSTAGNEAKCNYCRHLGAELAINYKTGDFVAECLAASENTGVNIILDMVGGDYLDRNIKVAADDGRIVMIAAMNGIKTEVNLLSIMQKRLVLTGSTLRTRPVMFKKVIADKLLKHVWPLLEAGKIKPCIYQTFPIKEAGSAHRLMESNEHTGKIMLELT